ncbi:uncharacterized protein LOC124373155 [Homalodisca vitripennis]|uniref:uncharacterized protein LOC124373155 n=1 Tax=Homalodisca vitripennis TaxID=197043 RepID=UPI001EEAED74|nr:uncharacterized protein LOC124373155 [Homalodisca vitripennis]
MARKKQREAQRKQLSTPEPTTTPAHLLPEVTSLTQDLNTEEDNVRPSLESPAVRRKQSIADKEQTVTESKVFQATYRQRSIPSRNNREDTNHLEQAKENKVTRTFRSRSESSRSQKSSPDRVKKNYDQQSKIFSKSQRRE